MKNSFKVGDKIRGLKGTYYSITNEEMELAEVKHINKNTGTMEIQILKHKSWKGYSKFFVQNSSEFFELAETKAFTKKDLKVGDIITLRNGRQGIYDGKNTYIRGGLDYDNIENNLTNNGSCGKSLDIVKVERIKEKEVVFERTERAEKVEILDEAEKAYLSSVIKPFRKQIEYIKKVDLRDEEFIEIMLEDDSIDLPCFKKGSMYKGMIAENSYSLEELGL